MLELRPDCECCNRDLPGDSDSAFICSYECTFCQNCATERLQLKCPNCSGELVPRPRRALETQPQSPPEPERPNTRPAQEDH
ncbi:DUF1272 domain-containing protein [Pseudomonas segetis]|uniref:RING-type domain-containing protein n=1 Tax=Pseudomonas segetis TaxID=298908 RepID=A0A239AHG5_9PSED|nr:hypothetical protein SAMN05216255_1190 [Pseudomonas segetis]